MTIDKLEHEYDTWHHKIFLCGIPIDPLTFPRYNAHFSRIKQNERVNLPEIACGRGEFVVWLTGVLPEISITAVDSSSAAIEFAEQYADAGCAKIEQAQDDAQELALPTIISTTSSIASA
jgi:2-polyprenyl-3-methyl-5-hydroxy-6-metoxy-1,4-benzoquinol methylase